MPFARNNSLFPYPPPLELNLHKNKKCNSQKDSLGSHHKAYLLISQKGGGEMGQQISVGSEKINKIKYFVLFLSNHGLNLVIEDKDKGATDGTQSIGTRTFEEGGHSLVFQNLREAVLSSFVCPFLLGFL